MTVDLSAFDGLDESFTTVLADPTVQERLLAFAEKHKEPVLSKNKELLGKHSDLQKQINELGGFEKLKTLAQQAADAQRVADEAAAKSGDVESVRRQAQAEIEKRDQRIAAMEQRELVAKTSSVVSKAIREAEGVSDLLEPHVRARIKSTLDADGKVTLTVLAADGTEMLADGVKPATVSDLLAELKANPTFAPAFTAKTISGTGAKPNAGPQGIANPWMVPTLNITKQMELVRSNPTLAKAFAAAAGKTLNI
jgi:hypothetical protein